MNEKTYKRTFHEVHTSDDGVKWFGSRESFDDNAEGKAKAMAKYRNLEKRTRHVRIVHVTKNVKILKVVENKNVMNKAEIAQLLAAGKTALAGIVGVDVCEGSLVYFGMSNISMSPSRVTVSFRASAALGVKPKFVKGDVSNEQSRKEWDTKAVELMHTTLAMCADKLQAAGVSFVKRDNEIELRPTR